MAISSKRILTLNPIVLGAIAFGPLAFASLIIIVVNIFNEDIVGGGSLHGLLILIPPALYYLWHLSVIRNFSAKRWVRTLAIVLGIMGLALMCFVGYLLVLDNPFDLLPSESEDLNDDITIIVAAAMIMILFLPVWLTPLISVTVMWRHLPIKRSSKIIKIALAVYIPFVGMMTVHPYILKALGLYPKKSTQDHLIDP
ncbi:hypothetical protein [Lewinella sp. 4G2]|uniref:hypothetical protein n=1 Tax=Lewinella sp. 4G2 TaxID=1803372 RepID=UPI0012FCB71D|nr:hypothetical protein [Lewinella sp. 4G2]